MLSTEVDNSTGHPSLLRERDHPPSEVDLSQEAAVALDETLVHMLMSVTMVILKTEMHHSSIVLP